MSLTLPCSPRSVFIAVHSGFFFPLSVLWRSIEVAALCIHEYRALFKNPLYGNVMLPNCQLDQLQQFRVHLFLIPPKLCLAIQGFHSILQTCINCFLHRASEGQWDCFVGKLRHRPAE